MTQVAIGSNQKTNQHSLRLGNLGNQFQSHPFIRADYQLIGLRPVEEDVYAIDSKVVCAQCCRNSVEH